MSATPGGQPPRKRQPIISELSRNRKLELLAGFLDGRKKVLEIGCGDGWFSDRLKRMGHEVVGIDVRGPADLIGDVLDWEKLGLTGGSFDAVVALEVIEHVDCLPAMTKLCRPDGIIFLSSPHPKWDWAMKALESLGLTQKRTSPHCNLTDFAKLPLPILKLKRPLWIHQVGVFRNNPRLAARP
jgi:2-polyprenyl-3-methyl-5-hydroxy-6-metoxy-1,4-benzoquinol methylase